jgi:hypothetical protein
MANHHTFPWQEAFLAALRQMPVIRHACDTVGIERTTAWRARQANKDFAQLWDDAMADGVDRAEQEAFRRGVTGWNEPVYHQGRLQYAYRRVPPDPEKGTAETWELALDESGQPIPATINKRSDSLLTLVLKGRRKEVYAERTEITGADGGPLAIDETTRRARMAAIVEDAKRRRAAEDFG